MKWEQETVDISLEPTNLAEQIKLYPEEFRTWETWNHEHSQLIEPGEGVEERRMPGVGRGEEGGRVDSSHLLHEKWLNIVAGFDVWTSNLQDISIKVIDT